MCISFQVYESSLLFCRFLINCVCIMTIFILYEYIIYMIILYKIHRIF
jgi:hypothetical protein